MKLIIAEKPSVACLIAGVVGAGKKKDGYLEGDGYIVSWCIGHLVEMQTADAYDERYAKLRTGDLPIIPGTWKYGVPKDKGAQFSILKRLMNTEDVDTVICATKDSLCRLRISPHAKRGRAKCVSYERLGNTTLGIRAIWVSLA